ncbi:thioesterase family protein [Ahrensia marina]|uniref:acyl-CoA thioesterase n=1 Tax=Ahrensia marina TaxID=1514904 RepID=UPI0035CF3DB5
MFQCDREIEWGECDAMGIVFYPSFFKWMDATFHAFTRSEGFDQSSLKNDYGLAGTPLVEAGCQFLRPGRYYDRLVVELTITKVSRSSFSLAYGFTIGDTPIARGNETRAFVAEKDGTIGKADLPEAIRKTLEKHHAG